MRYRALLCALPVALISISSVAATTDSLNKAYQAAVEDAKTAEPDEISFDLTAISRTNKNLVWKEASKEKLLAVTWTGWNGYDKKVNDSMTLSRDVWVTVAPQLQAFCKDLTSSDADKSLRLEQLMGLPPNGGKTRFVQLWVSPQDMFRPSPDPSVSDHEAELNFPVSAGMEVSESHKKWINDLKESSYGTNGYPWTRLGYTYDWGNPDSEVGLSEFVIKAGATVEIESTSDIKNYCS
ncbi:hypothetical protein [Spongorhabdus nitratireducens]